MTAAQRIGLEQAIFDYLVKEGLVQEGRHYEVDLNGMGKVWDEQLYSVVVQSTFKIEEVL